MSDSVSAFCGTVVSCLMRGGCDCAEVRVSGGVFRLKAVRCGASAVMHVSPTMVEYAAFSLGDHVAAELLRRLPQGGG